MLHCFHYRYSSLSTSKPISSWQQKASNIKVIWIMRNDLWHVCNFFFFFFFFFMYAFWFLIVVLARLVSWPCISANGSEHSTTTRGVFFMYAFWFLIVVLARLVPWPCIYLQAGQNIQPLLDIDFFFFFFFFKWSPTIAVYMMQHSLGCFFSLLKWNGSFYF